MIKEKTTEDKFDKLVSYIARGEGNLAFDYFERCLEIASAREETQFKMKTLEIIDKIFEEARSGK